MSHQGMVWILFSGQVSSTMLLGVFLLQICRRLTNVDRRIKG